ncbi:hypothetical protein Taro_005144 [Colocasia esculenta]|uniref:F-box domain-containing protein n=1 Tax=Colocasia esculenta TaxID=4460 RepID=A0A843TTK6_COLES|nr:hypothetical protein [Colocasia esculenta]
MGEEVVAAGEEGGAAAPLLLGLPDDVLGLIACSLRPCDVCSLILCCRGLRDALTSSDKVWLAQCARIGPSPAVLSRWQEVGGIASYQALCRFLLAVAPLLGIWVHQNPELGNVVCVVWGFLSVVGCRVIPQELGPLGLEGGPLLWAPVFEVVCGPDGSASCFFLHGRERDGGDDSLYPGSVERIDPSCNLLLLEVQVGGGTDQQCLAQSKSQAPQHATFSRLAFRDRRRILELVAGRVRLDVPPHLADAPLLPRSSSWEDATLLAQRRLSLIQLQKLGRSSLDHSELERGMDTIELNRSSDHRNCSGGSCAVGSSALGKRRSFSFSMGGYFKGGLKQILGKAGRANGAGESSKNCCRLSQLPSASSSSGESKYVHLHEFLMMGDSLGLSLRASKVKLSTYRAWPHMHDNRFALYKLPLQVPKEGQEYAGLWGGAFGWPPVQPSEGMPRKALFFLLLSYDEADGKTFLIGTKILEGTHYVLHPNGSAMFTVKVDEPSSDPFPWDVDDEAKPVEVLQSYSGEGIANGYGFRYPGSKPGSLFVIQGKLLAFVWKDSKVVLTLQRLDLDYLLRKGEKVPALPPIANFAYLTKSYSNVFASLPSSLHCSVSPRSGF